MRKGLRLLFFVIFLIIISIISYNELNKEEKSPGRITCVNYILNKETFVSGNLTVLYLNVSQGDSIFISNNGENMLIDCGPNGKGDDISKELKTFGITSIDYLILTHNDADHIGGCEEILNDFNVKRIIMNGGVAESQSYKDVMKLIDKEELIIASNCVSSNLGISEWQIIHNNTYSDNENQNSIVIALKYGKTGFLFMGDCDSSCEKSLLSQSLDIDFLKIAHHGSKYSATDEFLDKTTPRIALISVGKNSYGHPNPDCLSRLNERNIKILRTDVDGTIVLRTDGENYWIS